MKGFTTSNTVFCGLLAGELRTNSKTANNKRLKEILKRRASFGNQTVVFLSNSCGETNSGESNPFFVMRYAWRHRKFNHLMQEINLGKLNINGDAEKRIE